MVKIHHPLTPYPLSRRLRKYRRPQQGWRSGKSADRQGAKDIYERTLAEAQIVAESVLYAEARMGEMLAAIPDKKATSGGGSRSLPQGVDHKASHYAQQLARHPEAIQATVTQAKEHGDVPTRRDVLGCLPIPLQSLTR